MDLNGILLREILDDFDDPFSPATELDRLRVFSSFISFFLTFLARCPGSGGMDILEEGFPVSLFGRPTSVFSIVRDSTRLW